MKEHPLYILGIWDGHDAGAAILKGDNILAAINEERLTRRKLEVAFPALSVRACLDQACISPREIRQVAVASYDLTKTLARIFPSLKEEYYLIRRKKKSPGNFNALKKRLKYTLTEFGPNNLLKFISAAQVRKKLHDLGLKDCEVNLVEHHQCHAATAAYCSGFDDCLVATVDGIGDGLSATSSSFTRGNLVRKAVISGRHSIGIFFEHVTNLLNMRELEDEGKVMALANYAYPVSDTENPLIALIHIHGLDVKLKYPVQRMYTELSSILKRYPSEQFAYMAQRAIEVKLQELVINALALTGHSNVAMAGGVFANIKVNALIRNLPGVTGCFVFPHMGDGGLALGAAMVLNKDLSGQTSYRLDDLFWGPEYSQDDILSALKKSGLSFKCYERIEEEAAKLIAAGKIVFWFQGRMEYGPRALGNRSILALPNSTKIKDELNLRLKMRVWYQPFCPSILEDDARILLESYTRNDFMTMSYQVKEKAREHLIGVIGIDGSCRPQIVKEDDSRYAKLLREVRKLTGIGVVLNTSFNIHGEPLVCSPEDAIDTFKRSKNEYLIMGNYFVADER